MATTDEGGAAEAMEAAAEPPETPSPGAYDDFDSTCSTPYVSAPSSPGRPIPANGYFYSAPASPMHFFAMSSGSSTASIPLESDHFPGRFSGPVAAVATDFEFSARFPTAGPDSGSSSPATMISADELFLNGQIRPMRPSSSNLQKPPRLEPLPDDAPGADVPGFPEGEETLRGREFRSKNRSIHRRTRSLSPLRSSEPVWAGFPPEDDEEDEEQQKKPADPPPVVTAARRSRRWMSLKDFLYRSKSEGRGYVKEKLSWSALSFSPSSKEKEKDKEKDTDKDKEKDKEKKSASSSAQAGAEKKKKAAGVNGAGKRRVPAPSAHELHYAAKRAQAEEMRKKTYLPYRQGLLGCLGFSSRSYSVVNGFAKALHHHHHHHNQPVPSS
ncbi:unnamed protein product [Victoria cruziana]